MLSQQIAHRYSTALFHIVRERGLMEKAQEQFKSLDELIRMDSTLIQFLLAPHILDQKKVELLRTIFGPRLEPLFLEFLLVLFDKHRIGFLHDIIIALLELMAQEQGIIVTHVTTAVPLTESEKQRLTGRLRAKTGKTIALEEKVDPSILGGMIVVLKDQIIDGSVKHHLSLLKEELMKLKVA